MNVDHEEWNVEVVADFREPGWFHIPRSMTTTEANAWVESALVELGPLVGVRRWDGSVTSPDVLRDFLAVGVADEPSLPSIATFQVWPIPGPAVLTCRVCLVERASVPDFTDVEGAVVHTVEAAELGTGIQFSTRHSVEDGEGKVALFSVDLVFADDDVAVVFSLERSVASMIAGAMPGLDVLKDLIRVTRHDGTQVRGHAPTNALNESPWEMVGNVR